MSRQTDLKLSLFLNYLTSNIKMYPVIFSQGIPKFFNLSYWKVFNVFTLKCKIISLNAILFEIGSHCVLFPGQEKFLPAQRQQWKH